MKYSNSLKRSGDPALQAAGSIASPSLATTVAMRNGGLRLVPSIRNPDYWQTDSRDEALKRAIARTG